MEKRILFNTNQLKYLALVFMFLDSLFFSFPGIFPAWIHLITRFVAPLFAFFTVEGFFHSSSRKKHLKRLWLAAGLMQLGNFLSYLLLGPAYQITDNIFLTLALGYSVIFLFETGKTKSAYRLLFYLAGLLLFISGLIFSVLPIVIRSYSFGVEGGIQILFTMLIFWAFYGNRQKQVLVFLLWNLLLLALMGPDFNISQAPSFAAWFAHFCYNSDSLTFLFLPIIFLYNGQKGSKKPIHKWIFYIFYPLQFWLLHLLAYFIHFSG
ncbi:conjugal transfer protein TraX [Streptococcus chenjunshii]|uniref:Conjugal transfer protein TraX n=1 Tax=Streptococcus chenjunshii TaxID=2173853 RepID=A0A372KLZ3_9STRE|nr:TraX family protein [Streptococcus chenjunshii]AXQ78063.1 conjugal transfer protein TraX [Streptococcus chenjunshii]RFU51158.1 conjugal transfer protein TraX [Streptococcus chenjunshii]RFU53302.1 conjugal transfer protein TraX [Streptococcus chenjunshii]